VRWQSCQRASGNYLRFGGFTSMVALPFNACLSPYNTYLLSRVCILTTALLWRVVTSKEWGRTGTLSHTSLACGYIQRRIRRLAA